MSFSFSTGTFIRDNPKPELARASALFSLILGFFFVGLRLLTFTFGGLMSCLCLQANRGLGHVIFRDAFNVRIPSPMRATANSVLALGSRFLFIFWGPALGLMIDFYGHTPAYAVMAGVYVFNIFFFFTPLFIEGQKLSYQKNLG